MSCFVLIHGGWHGGWCWRRVAKNLRDLGHEVFTPTLTGMGERQPRVQTVDGQRTPENRRVEVEVNGMGGQ